MSITGKVIKGDGRGKKLGFPTANISINKEVIPPLGAYAVRVSAKNRKYFGMANIGRRPSFNGRDAAVNIEVHIFRFSGDLYGKEIDVEFLKKMRNEANKIVFRMKSLPRNWTFDMKRLLQDSLRRT